MGSDTQKNVKPISTLGIPVQVFIIFMVQNKKDFTVTDAITELDKLHKINLSFHRMKQILDDLVLSENLMRDIKPNGMKNKITTFYTFNKIL